MALQISPTNSNKKLEPSPGLTFVDTVIVKTSTDLITNWSITHEPLWV